MQGEGSRTIGFDGFSLDLARGCLRRGGEEIRLRPKSFQALQYLVENRARLISKEELIKAVWPNAFVTDNSLVQCLLEIRRALGDDAQTMIRTVPRRGYIFDVPVHSVADPSDSPRSTDEGAHPERRDVAAPSRGNRRRAVLAVGLALVPALLGVALAMNLGGARQRLFGGTTVPTVRSLVVLPLDMLSNDPDMDYFAEGITDALITDLAQIESLRVISRTTAMQYKKPRQALPEIARELGVDAVIEGTVSRSGDRVRITTQLVLAREDRHIWARSYEGELRDVLGLQDTVARDIAEQIKVRITPRARAMFASAPSIDPGAYDAYLKSRQFIFRRTPDGATKSLEYARRALALQPGSALLYANLADSYITMNLLSVLPARDAMPQARAAAQQALSMDGSLARAHFVLAMVAFNYDWDFRGAEQEFTRALEIEPGSAETRTFRGFYLSAMGRHDEAVTEMRRAVDLDPLSMLENRNVGSALYYARRYDEAITQFEHTAALDPNYPVVYNWLEWTCLAAGRDAQAAEWALTAMANDGTPSAEVAASRAAIKQGGPRRYWQTVIAAEIRAGATETPGNRAYNVAALLTYLGDTQSALHYLQRAFDERSYWMPFLNVDPRFDPLREDARFDDLIRRIGLHK